MEIINKNRKKMKRQIFFLLLLITCLLTSCPKEVQIDDEWFTFGHNETRNNTSSTGPKPPLILKWKFKTDGRIVYPPVVTKNVVYFGSRDGYIYALSTDGELLWKYDMEKGGLYHSLTFKDSILYAGSWTQPYSLIAIDAQTGQLISKMETGEVTDLPLTVTVNNNVVYINTDEMDLTNTPAFSLPKTLVSFMAMDNKSGEIKWKIPINGVMNAPAAIFKNNLYIITSDENWLYALDELTGNIKWKYALVDVSLCTPVIEENNIFINDKRGNIYCIDREKGILVWRYKLNTEIYSSLAVSKGVVFIGGEDGYLYAFDSKNTELKWKFKTLKPITANAVIGNGYVYFGSLDDYIYILDEETGKVLWRYKTNDDIEAGVAISNKMLFLGSADGYLYAFTESKIK